MLVGPRVWSNMELVLWFSPLVCWIMRSLVEDVFVHRLRDTKNISLWERYCFGSGWFREESWTSQNWSKLNFQAKVQRQASWNATYPPVYGSWGAYIGHGGDTYGFLSESGVLPQFNATFSAIANEAKGEVWSWLRLGGEGEGQLCRLPCQEYLGPFVKNVMVCKMIEVAAKVLLNQEIFLKSSS